MNRLKRRGMSMKLCGPPAIITSGELVLFIDYFLLPIFQITM